MNPKFRKLVLYWFVGLLSFLFMGAFYTQYKKIRDNPQTDRHQTLVAMEDVMKDEKIAVNANDPFSIGMRFITSTNVNEQRKGMQMIMATDPARGGPILIRLLSSPDDAIKVAAMKGLGGNSYKPAGPSIARLLKSKDLTVRRTAATFSAQFASERGMMAPIGSALKSRDKEIVSNALRVWRSAYPSDPKNGLIKIRSPLTSNNQEIVSSAIGAVSSVVPAKDIRKLDMQLKGVERKFPGTAVATTAKSLLLRSQ